MKLHEQKEMTYSHECFHKISVFSELIKFAKKALRKTKETNLALDDLLKKDKSVSIHQRNLQILATVIYKVKNDLGPEIMKNIFHFVQKPYNLRNDSTLQRQGNCTLYFGTESISSLAPK